MGDSVKENIMKNLKTLLEGITVANGYNNTVLSVQRYKREGNSLVNCPCIVIVSGDETSDDHPHPYTTCLLQVAIEAWLIDNPDASDPTDSFLNSILADVKKILRTGTNYTLGGYCQDINIKSSTPFEAGSDGEAYTGLVIETEIIYRHLQNDPETHG